MQLSLAMWKWTPPSEISSALNLQELDLHQNTQQVDLHPHSEILESSYLLLVGYAKFMLEW